MTSLISSFPTPSETTLYVSVSSPPFESRCCVMVGDRGGPVGGAAQAGTGRLRRALFAVALLSLMVSACATRDGHRVLHPVVRDLAAVACAAAEAACAMGQPEACVVRSPTCAIRIAVESLERTALSWEASMIVQYEWCVLVPPGGESAGEGTRVCFIHEVGEGELP